MSFPRLAVVVAGFATGALAKRWQARDTGTPPHASLTKIAREMRLQAAAYDRRLRQLEAQLAAHEAKLQETPSTAQMRAALDKAFTEAMAGVDERLTAQAQSIETLQMTVTQTDDLLERVLESLDLLRGDPPERAA